MTSKDSEINKENEIIEYILPLENIEVIREIKNNQNNLSLINLTKIFDEEIDKDHLFVIITYEPKLTKFFIKGSISQKSFKNLSLSNNLNEQITNTEILIFLKRKL